MAKSVIWKRKANLQILEIESYLLENFSSKAAYKFIDKLYEKLDRISRSLKQIH